MRAVLLGALGLLALAPDARAQWPTGEVHLVPLVAWAPRVTHNPGYGDLTGPPDDAALAGGMGDLSFITGRFRLGPEGFVLRGADRRVWGLGGVARYEFSTSRVRPYLLAGAGAYFWERTWLVELPPEYGSSYTSWGSDVDYFTLSGGAGLSLGPPHGQLALVAELRGHTSIQQGGGAGRRSLMSLGIGGRISW